MSESSYHTRCNLVGKIKTAFKLDINKFVHSLIYLKNVHWTPTIHLSVTVVSAGLLSLEMETVTAVMRLVG